MMRLCAHCSHQLLNLIAAAAATVIVVSCYCCTICCADRCGDDIYVAAIAATAATAAAVTVVVALVLSCAIFGICWHNGVGDEIIRRLQNALGVCRSRITVGAA